MPARTTRRSSQRAAEIGGIRAIRVGLAGPSHLGSPLGLRLSMLLTAGSFSHSPLKGVHSLCHTDTYKCNIIGSHYRCVFIAEAIERFW
ncbi:hypothetical protein AGR6A_Cc60479 [Agrobacterium sp. NCPPB 925]|nr:hypothetical protein AGR6A_Cc60479 [Agrobacterium sp. NCPPB 925]